jgi:magnesium transporter
MRAPETRLSEIMETAVVSVNVHEDQEEVAQQVARYDFLAIPVVDEQHKLLGIITYDDIIDVVREEATEDAHRIAAVEPLTDSYLRTGLLTLAWKRGVWLTILFVGAVATAFALKHYEPQLDTWKWLMFFVPLVVSCGGNTGNQSATLIITSLNSGDVALGDWLRIAGRELVVGAILGACLGVCGMLVAGIVSPDTRDLTSIWVLPLTIATVVVFGSLIGSMLPLFFLRLGLDPALMSNPFVAGIIDILGIVIYINVAYVLLS